MDEFDLESYDYFLPPELVASKPVMPRGEARLLVYERKSGEIHHHKFKELAQILPPCKIIFNDTKVIKARIFGKKDSGGAVEVLLNQPVGEGVFNVFVRGKVSTGTQIRFGENLACEVLRLCEDGSREVKFNCATSQLFSVCERIGHVPLPPYIKRADTAQDESWYQSVFAKFDGAVAAPTASLHFDEEALAALRASSHELFYLTLHVGAGTFKGVESSDIRAHKMHSEAFCMGEETARLVASSEAILGVGTTVTRVVEFFARRGERSGFCDLFLHPNNKPIRQNYLLTNFHLPRSTLIMLVASFVGLEETKRIYAEAVKERYRFYSYGDGMLVL